MITGLLHASFLVADLKKARAFYEDVLGLAADPNRPDLGYPGVWYTLDAQINPQQNPQQIHLMQLPNPEAGLTTRRPDHGGRDRHVALAVSDLAALSQLLSNADIAYTLSKSGRRALFCRDPDQNALEFIERCYA